MNKIFVGSISWNTGEQELIDLFAQVGEIEDAKVITDRETGRSRGFGFVTFTSSEAANTAVSQFDGTELDGRNIKVNIANEIDRSKSRNNGGSNRQFDNDRRW